MPTWSLFDDDVRSLKSNLLRFMENGIDLRRMEGASRSYKEQAKRELAHRLVLEERIETMIANHNKLLDRYEELKDILPRVTKQSNLV